MKNSDLPSEITNLLKVGVTTLNNTQSDDIFKLLKMNLQTNQVASTLANELVSNSAGWLETFQSNINFLTPEEQEKANSIFSSTLLNSIKVVSDRLYVGVKEGKGLLFNCLLSEQTTEILDSILKFKKEIDSTFPGASDMIIGASTKILTGIICAYAPAAGVILKASGVLDKTADFLKTDNLEASIDKLKTKIIEMERDKKLATIKTTGVALSDLSEQTKVSAKGLQKIGLNLNTIKMIGEELIDTPLAKEYIGKICNYADKAFPDSKKQLTSNMESIKGSIMQVLKDAKTNPKDMEKIEQNLDKRISEVTKILETTLDPKASFYDKLAAQQDGIRMILDCTQDIKKELGKPSPSLIAAINKTTIKVVQNKLQGAVDIPLVKNLPPEVKKLAKEALGATLANQVSIQRGIEKQINSPGRQM